MSRTAFIVLLAFSLQPVAAQACDLHKRAASKTVLGVALGTVVSVEGKMVADDFRRSRADVGKTFVRIQKVNGKALPKPVLLAVSQFSFHKVKLPAPGKTVNLAGYQTGGYTGIPRAAFQYIPQVATAGFQFETYFQVCALIRSNP
jgi:hypothetical protein